MCHFYFSFFSPFFLFPFEDGIVFCYRFARKSVTLENIQICNVAGLHHDALTSWWLNEDKTSGLVEGIPSKIPAYLQVALK